MHDIADYRSICALVQAGRSLDDSSAVQAAASDGGWQQLTGRPLPPPRIAPVGSGGHGAASAASPAASSAASPAANSLLIATLRKGRVQPATISRASAGISGSPAAAGSPVSGPAAGPRRISVAGAASAPAAAAAAPAQSRFSAAPPGMAATSASAAVPSSVSRNSSVSELRGGSASGGDDTSSGSSDEEGFGVVRDYSPDRKGAGGGGGYGLASGAPQLAHARTIGVPRNRTAHVRPPPGPVSQSMSGEGSTR